MAKKKRDATKVSFLLDNQLIKRLEEFCQKTGRTKTKVIEMAILQFLEKYKDEE